MRNEIFNRIRQNKMKYYAELNNVKEKAIPVTVSEDKKLQIETPKNERQPKEKNAFLKNIQEYNYKAMFIKVPKFVKSNYQEFAKSPAVNSLKMKVKNDHEKIRQLNKRVNQKIELQQDRLAHGIYNMSSFLFEEQNDKNNGVLAIETVSDNSVEWSVSKETVATTSIYERLGNFSDKSFNFLRTVPGRINTYLASDNMMEPNDAHMIARK